MDEFMIDQLCFRMLPSERSASIKVVSGRRIICALYVDGIVYLTKNEKLVLVVGLKNQSSLLALLILHWIPPLNQNERTRPLNTWLLYVTHHSKDSKRPQMTLLCENFECLQTNR